MKVLTGLVFAIALSAGLAQAQGSRLIAIAGSRWDTLTGWYAVDTSAIFYSGGRGGDIEVGVDYDSWIGMDWVGSTLEPTEMIEQTYDGANRVTTNTRKDWNGTSWVNKRQTQYNYDAFGRLLEETDFDWDGNNWQRGSRDKYTYDSNGKVLTKEYFSWNGSQIQSGLLETYTYSATNKVVSQTNQSWVNGAWKNTSRNVNTYNSMDSLDTNVFENWPTGTSSWNPVSRSFYHYNSSGLLDTASKESHFQGVWSKTGRKVYTYNQQGMLLDELSQAYSNGGYTNSGLLSYADSLPANIQDWTSYSWSSGSWRPNGRAYTIYLTNAKNKVLNNIYYSYTPQGNWEVGWVDTVEYNSFQQRTRSIHQEFDNGIVEDKSERRYYYELYQPSGIGSTAPAMASSVFPNPFTLNVAIQVVVAQAGEHTFEVYNMAGQKVHTETRYWPAGTQTIVLDGQALPKGVYIYQVKSATGVAKGKLVKQ